LAAGLLRAPALRHLRRQLRRDVRLDRRRDLVDALVLSLEPGAAGGRRDQLADPPGRGRGGPRDGPPDWTSEGGYAPLGLPRPTLGAPRGTRGAPRSPRTARERRGEGGDGGRHQRPPGLRLTA